MRPTALPELIQKPRLQRYLSFRKITSSSLVKMLRIGMRKSHNWHEQVNKTAGRGGPLLISGSPNPAFPWAQLQTHTDVYLKKKGTITLEERDRRLLLLIQKHDAIQISVAACAQKISPEALRAYMVEELKTAQIIESPDLETSLSAREIGFLEAIVAAHYVNPSTFTDSDSKIAQALSRCCSSGLTSTSQNLQELARLLIAGIPSHSFAYPYAIGMVHFYSAKLSAEIQALRESHSWLKAHTETAWLSKFRDEFQGMSPGEADAIEILYERFPNWKLWAEWSESDSQLAQVLEECHLSGGLPPLSVKVIATGMSETPVKTIVSRKLERLVKACIIGGPNNKSFVYDDAWKVVREHSMILSQYVRTLKEQNRWVEAHTETEWFSTLLDPLLQSPNEGVEVTQLLCEIFPDWRAWANWGESENHMARALIPCLRSDVTAVSQHLKIVIGLLAAGVSTQSILHSEVCRLARKFSVDLARTLHALALESQWCKAWKESQWLSMLPDQSAEPPPGYLEATQELGFGLESWRAWALWRPDVHRLFMQERLNARQRDVLRDLLALEGPDFILMQYTTLREALIAQHLSCRLPKLCWRKIQLKVNEIAGDARDMLERLSNTVNATCTRRAPEINLLAYLCCTGRLIDDGILKILGADSLIGDSLVSADVLLILLPQREAGGRDSQMAAVIRLLSVMSRPNSQALRDALSTYLVETISNSVREIQALLSIQMENSDCLMGLHAFGLSVQAAQWVQPLLDDSLGTLIGKWPSKEKFVTMDTLRSDILQSSRGHVTALGLKINEFYSECFIESGTMDQDSRNMVEALILLWQHKPDTDRRYLALVIANGRGAGSEFRCECLRQLRTVPPGVIQELRQISESYTKDPDGFCIKVARLFATTVLMDNENSLCWRSVIYNWIKDRDSTLLEYSLTHLPAHEWFQWLSDLQMIVTGIIVQEPQSAPSVFQPAFLEWARSTRRYCAMISCLESTIGSGPATQCLLAGFKSEQSESILQILRLLESYFEDSDDGRTLQPAVQATISLLNRAYGSNAMEICQALSILQYTTTNGTKAYLRILEVYQNASRKVAHVLLGGWLRHPKLTGMDQLALKALEKLFGPDLKDSDYTHVNALHAAGDYLASQVTSLLEESDALCSLRRSLAAIDRKGTSALLAELEIEDTSPLEDEVACLPPELVDVIEIVGEDVVELQFPLANHTGLQKTGMGTSNAQSLIVRLVVGNSSLPSGFCMHFDNELKDHGNINSHSPWLVLDNVNDAGTSFCHGYVNRAKFQLGKVLSRYLLGDSKPLEDTYKFMKLSLDNISSNCIACGTSLGIQLRRSAVCSEATCSTKFVAGADLRIQLYDLQKDAQVGDLLISAAQAAATTDNMDLLPECPINQAKKTIEILSKLNHIRVLQSSEDLRWELGRLGKTCVPLFKWIFGYYRGFLVSASGQMRIPSMPGVHQFLLANAAPDLEVGFSTQMGSVPTKVVFHGTSLDRLYAILCQGLRVCSGDATLQRHGAVYGNGIYVAQEPGTAMGYATEYNAPAAGSGWRSDTFNNVRVLLGCEASGDIPAERARGIHVVANPNMLILRYVFLVPRGVRMPIANHVVPAMTSVFASLRSGDL